MSRTVQCASVQRIGNAHSHNTPEGITNPRTLPAQISLKALASAVIDRTLPRTLPAQSEQTARTLPAQNTLECAGNVQHLSIDFKLATRWWLVHFLDGAPVEVWTDLPATQAEVLQGRPDAVAAQPLHQAAPEPIAACSTGTHATYRRGKCGEPVAAGLSDVPGVIRYRPDQGATCPAWLAILPADLEARILAMAERWDYSGDDLTLALAGARSDPDGWRKVLESDERGQ